jgi:hypothetical protein
LQQKEGTIEWKPIFMIEINSKYGPEQFFCDDLNIKRLFTNDKEIGKSLQICYAESEREKKSGFNSLANNQAKKNGKKSGMKF